MFTSVFRDVHNCRASAGNDAWLMLKREISTLDWSFRPVLAVLTVLMALALAAPAGATVGQISTFGSLGTGNGQFTEPSMLGVDPSDGSIYVGDVTAEEANYRIQKFSAGGTFEASVLIPHYLDLAKEKVVALWGIAIDPTLHRFYLLEGGKKEEKTGEIVARRIRVYSTIPSGTALVPASPATIELPEPENEKALYKPLTIAVDPTPGNDEIEIMAEQGPLASPRRLVLQRFHADGTEGARFTDTEGKLRPAGASAFSMAISPGAAGIASSGTTYVMTGRPDKAAKSRTRAWEIPQALTGVQEVPGFAAAIDSEESPFGEETSTASTTTGGPRMAVSADGKTLFWKEVEVPSEENTAGKILVHGYALDEKATRFVYGGGSSTCRISTSTAGLTAGLGEKVIVGDYGPIELGVTPSFGDKVLTFGPTGSGCLGPVAKFKANTKEGDIEVNKGETVTFADSSGEIKSGPKSTAGFRKEVIWNFGDGTEEVFKSSGTTEAATTATHKYNSSGAFEATLKIHLSKPTYGNPQPVSHKVTVKGGTEEKRKLTVTATGNGTVTGPGINCPGDCTEEYVSGTAVKLVGTPGTGSKAATWTGCDNVSASNECELTMGADKGVTGSFALEKHKLTVSVNGTGSVTGPGDINCPGTCSAEFDHGTAVTLVGHPSAGSKPATWTGCGNVNASDECEVTMSEAKSVTATFGLEKHQLSVIVNGNGSVTGPSGINCPGTCSAEFEHNTPVKLVGAPGTGGKPATWSGCDNVNVLNECEVTMNGAKSVTATFTLEKHPLNVTVEGGGSGTVSGPGGINCPGACSAEFDHNTPVTLVGHPSAGSKVTWTGCDHVNASSECEVTMSAAKNVTATFALEKHKLTVSVNGNGSVTGPGGINCPGACSAEFDHGTPVKLVGHPGANTNPATWSGCGNVNASGECEVTISEAKNVTATFAKEKHLLSVTVNGNGSITGPGGINCPGACSAEFDHNTPVTLVGHPSAGSKPATWLGCGNVNASNECEVTLSEAKNVTATFALEKHKLTVSVNGSGSVTGPGGINCPGTCSAEFDHNTPVTLVGHPSAGSKPATWSGCGNVNASGECEVTLSEVKNVTATFGLEKHKLTVSVEGTGSGSVTGPGGINCPGTCSAEFDHGTEVTLSAASDPGTDTVVWTGCASNPSPTECKVALNGAKSVIATFSPENQIPLIITKEGSGFGTVESTPAGISCPEACSHEYPVNTAVKLTGTPTAGTHTKAVVWTGCDHVNASNECEVTMSAAKNVTATFALEKHKLTVSVNGNGSVTGPGGINCPGTCSAEFDHNTSVTLVGHPSAGSKPATWSGCGNVNASGECEVTISEAKNVTATFALEKHKLTVSVEGTGSGTVTGPGGIACPGTCSAEFDHGTAVKLVGHPGANTKPATWAGCDNVNASNECEVTMSAAKNVTATFAKEKHLLSVTVSGSGSVTGTGINCPGTCSAEFDHGAAVKLVASADPHSKPATWAGCDNVNASNECEVTMSAAKSVTATFAKEKRQLSVGVGGNGSGTVTGPGGINCPGICSAEFDFETEVTLSAVSDPGSKPVTWTGCGSNPTPTQCTVTMTAAKNVTATFAKEKHLLSVTVNGSGSGSVTGPGGINCPGTCSAEFDHGAAVKLIGASETGSKPATWAGCDNVNVLNECEVTMTAAKNVTATFAKEKHLLSVTVSGSGSVTGPGGINCPGACSAEFDHNTPVTLVGHPSAGSKPATWSGCGNVNASNECEVTISEAKNVTATFAKEKHPLSVTVNGGGTGSVTGPGGINCPGACSAEFDHGTPVKLVGTPGTGGKPATWLGCDNVNASNECEVTMSAAKSVTATFPLETYLLSVTVEGGGSGTVSGPGGIDCPGACSAEFEHETEVTLSASSDPGSEAATWTGCDDVNPSNECEVTMSAAKNVTATFAVETNALKVEIEGNGSGSVTGPGGINCPGACSGHYVFGTEVKLGAASVTGTRAVTWGGCDNVNASNECEVTVDAAVEVTATFKLEKRELIVFRTGTGAGHVASGPAGIGCGGTCHALFDYGTVVLLTGTSGAGTQAIAWSGCAEVTSTNRCKVTLDATKGVTATFAPIATAPPQEAPEEVEAEPLPEKKKKTRKQKALARCRKLKKGHAKAKCLKRARAIGGRR
jgi:hypothetical protein